VSAERDRELPSLAAARLWAAARFPYLARGLFSAQVSADPGIKTVAVESGWRVHADPEIVANWTPAQLGSVLVHHVCHLLREHGQRADTAGVTKDAARTWNLAADAEINDDLASADLQLPGHAIFPRQLRVPFGGLAEEYFRLGRSEATGSTEAAHAWARSAEEWEIDCGSGADGIRRPWDSSGPSALSGYQAELLSRRVAEDVTRAARVAGVVPGGLVRWARQVLEPVVDWRRVLAAELRRAVADAAGAVDYSYRRPSRRATVAGNVVLPSLRRPVPEIAVVCDTSGSMTEAMLAMALGEIEGLLRSVGLARQVRVLACDTATGAARRVSSASQVELTGGGGTDMGVGIAAAAALRPPPAVTVVITDGMTPWPDRPPRGTRVVVCLLGDRAPDAPAWARSIRVRSAS
jgi:predicted metal-dependent peptidase